MSLYDHATLKQSSSVMRYFLAINTELCEISSVYDDVLRIDIFWELDILNLNHTFFY